MSNTEVVTPPWKDALGTLFAALGGGFSYAGQLVVAFFSALAAYKGVAVTTKYVAIFVGLVVAFIVANVVVKQFERPAIRYVSGFMSVEEPPKPVTYAEVADAVHAVVTGTEVKCATPKPVAVKSKPKAK